MNKLKKSIGEAYNMILDAQQWIEELEVSGEVQTGELKQSKDSLEQSRRWMASHIRIKTEKEAMLNYEKQMESHNAFYAMNKPKREEFADDIEWNVAFNIWSMNKSLFEPNKPGYHRANND
jgi:hypothetical protein